MHMMNWICLALSIPVIAVCFYAKRVAKRQRKRYSETLKADFTFGPMCRCGHRLSMHVGSMQDMGQWCRSAQCPCGDYKGVS